MTAMSEVATKRPPGRPRVYADDAERAAAYRQRVAASADVGEMLLYLWRKPTPDLIRQLAQKYAERLDDKALAGANMAQALVDGLKAGGGENCAEAAVNFIKFEHKRSGE